MKFFRIVLIAAAVFSVSLPGAHGLVTHHKKASAHKVSAHGRKTRKERRVAAKSRGQQAIDPARATQIQQALVREHYMSGSPSGEWDQDSKDAMARYQAANGWQTKVIPDSRALIKLGLGPESGGVAAPASTASAPAPAINAIRPVTGTAATPAGTSPTLGSAITAHNNVQHLLLPD